MFEYNDIVVYFGVITRYGIIKQLAEINNNTKFIRKANDDEKLRYHNTYVKF